MGNCHFPLDSPVYMHMHGKAVCAFTSARLVCTDLAMLARTRCGNKSKSVEALSLSKINVTKVYYCLHLVQ